MPRRRPSILDDVYETLLVAPWWFGLPFAAAVYFLLRDAVPALLEHFTAVTTDPIAGPMHRTIALVYGPVSVKLAPLITLIVLGVWIASLFDKWRRQIRR